MKFADCLKNLTLFDPSQENSWNIIDMNTPHEFFPEEDNMVVISFHTFPPDELIEIKWDSGEQRMYEK